MKSVSKGFDFCSSALFIAAARFNFRVAILPIQTVQCSRRKFQKAFD
jgi:hypothetical protein